MKSSSLRDVRADRVRIARSCTDERRCGDFMSITTLVVEKQLLELVSTNSVGHPVLYSSCCVS